MSWAPIIEGSTSTDIFIQTLDQAKAYAEDLKARVPDSDKITIVESSKIANYKFIGGRLILSRIGQ